MEDHYYQYVDELEQLRVLAKGSNIPHSTLQSDGLYAVRQEDARQYVEDFYKELNNLCCTAWELLVTHVFLLHNRKEFLRAALWTARTEDFPDMVPGVRERLADARLRIDRCGRTIEMINMLAARYVEQGELKKTALRTDNPTELVKCDLVVPELMERFPDFVMNTEVL